VTAFGRKLPFDQLDFQQSERPLSVKADLQHCGSRKFTSERPLSARKQTLGWYDDNRLLVTQSRRLNSLLNFIAQEADAWIRC
jgi:hypothetical protein